MLRTPASKDKPSVPSFSCLIGKDAYSLNENLAVHDMSNEMTYKDGKVPPLQHLKPVDFEAAERVAFHSGQEDRFIS